ncbi:MAG: OsmC family peroxiredoxin [Bacteroidetes bacterium]|nr:MAG: OsmC family peroxiredoxin [Bacteroidota bacterium]
MSSLHFSVVGQSVTPTKFVAQARQFEVVIDEPPVLGGQDDAANPVEYILAGYAGCLNVVGHLVAKELGIHLRKLSIRIEGDINPARFLGQPTEERAGYKSLQVHLLPETDEGPELLQKWLQIVEARCPVNDNLRFPTPISITLPLTSRVYPN